MHEEFKKIKTGTGKGFTELREAVNQNNELLNVIEKDNRLFRHTQQITSVRISRYIPVDSPKGLRCLFRVSKMV